MRRLIVSALCNRHHSRRGHRHHLGADGFLWLESGPERRATPPRFVFHAAFELAIIERASVAAAAGFGSAAATLKCTRFDAARAPATRPKVARC
jgi:hypothetical protein